MFFFLPWGHDQPVYERPWATYALIVTCCAVHLIGADARERSNVAVQEAAEHFTAVRVGYPRARISFPVNGLPSVLDEVIRPLIDDSRPAATAGDRALEESVRGLVDAINMMPSVRFGWRSGAPTPMRLFTHMFMHADIFHLGGNMLLLWIAGGLLESFWRRWAFLLLYVFSGFAGLFAFYITAPQSLTPLVGASGAIAGLMGAFVVGHPKVRIKIAWLSFLLLRPRWGSWQVPAWVVLPMWVTLELFKAMVDYRGLSGVAYWAHVGGFAFGALAALVAKQFHLVAEDAGYDRAEPETTLPRTVRPASVLPLARVTSTESLPIPTAPAVPAERPVVQRQPPRELELSDLRETGEDIIER
jgi:membrane associated rhomboid family serine protease